MQLFRENINILLKTIDLYVYFMHVFVFGLLCAVNAIFLCVSYSFFFIVLEDLVVKLNVISVSVSFYIFIFILTRIIIQFYVYGIFQ